jgi:ABC-type multidrug transport system fused ATPase/permease subunit
MNFFKKYSVFLDGRLKIYVVGYFIFQIVISCVEVLSLGMIPFFIYYIQNETLLEKKISYLSDFINYDLSSFGLDTIILYGFVLLIFLLVIKNIFTIFFNYYESALQKTLNNTNINKLFSKYIYLDMQFYFKTNASDFLRNLISEVPLATGYIITIMNIAKEIILIISLLILLFFNDFLITIIVSLFFLLFSGIIILYLRNRLYHKGKKFFDSKSHIIKNIHNCYGALREIKIYKIEDFFIRFFKKNLHIKLKNEMYRSVVTKLPRNIFEIGIIFVFAAIVVFMKYQGNSEDFLPTLALLGAACVRILPSFSRITSIYSNIRFYKTPFSKIYEELKKDNSDQKTIEKKIINYDDFNILSFDNLNFKYGDKTIFKDFSFKIKKNKLTGIIGKTGSGKSTLLNIILGLLEPTKGNIKIDGKAIEEKQIKLNFPIGYVPQETFLIDASILENVAIGIPVDNIDISKIEKILKIVELNDFIKNLDKGIYTRLGNNGIEISGGQKQRLGIARALYRKPNLLIFDESTNSLDNATKFSIFENIISDLSNMSIIIVTHDTDLLKYLDITIDLNKID